ncbi:hypothetical protein ACFV2S_29810 [Streptomyces sp. NPDC059695]|uniref:hypothetical protein n=1 Tax=Streptomyces sp. NPDC059695 TaxID=3346910 RepID=UPI00368881E6
MEAARREGSAGSGGTAPWAKVLGAVLLVPVVALAVLHAVAEAREAGREREAFEATRADAARFADALVATGGGTPSDQDVRDALDRFAGDGPRLGKLAAVIPAEHGTRVLVSFSRPYERGVTLFGPSDAMARPLLLPRPPGDRPGPAPGHGPRARRVLRDPGRRGAPRPACISLCRRFEGE